MGKRFIDGIDFVRMMITATLTLKEHVPSINQLNVFPVPDGDTGTNMHMTMQSGIDFLTARSSTHVGQCAEVMSKGLLMGARGNSGVILSQLFRGFARSIAAHPEVNTRQFAEAMQNGVETAYQAVVKPVEGTILTVSRESAKHATSHARTEEDMAAFLQEVVKKAKESLASTPNLLPVLKQAGVVDSGGQGLVYVYEGCLQALATESFDEMPMEVGGKPVDPPDQLEVVAASVSNTGGKELYHESDIEFPYDMEFFICMPTESAAEQSFVTLRKQLSKIGDSLLVIAEDNLIKVHIHTKEPGDVFNLCLKYGELTGFHLANMKDQHRSWQLTQAAEDESDLTSSMVYEPVLDKVCGLVAVSVGTGIANIFESIGADMVLSGGQTMNPSTEDIVQAVRAVHAHTVFVLPNNSNIIMAANQAAQVTDLDVVVIPSRSIQQGLAAALAYSSDASRDDNIDSMHAAIASVRSGQVTTAVRDAEMDGIQIKEGEFIALADAVMVASEANVYEACRKLLDHMLRQGEEVLTLLYGVDANPADTERLRQYVESAFPRVEIQVLSGNQPLYPYLFSLE